MTIRNNNRKGVPRGIEIVIACLCLFGGEASAQWDKPVKLECESLITPLGMDAKKPVLSWKLQDPGAGARQTAYEIQVASSSSLFALGKSGVWDSTRGE